MAARRLFLAAFSLSLVAPLSSLRVLADDASPVDANAEVENAKHSFVGAINANSVYVRSGPHDDAYPTMKLDKGTQVTVIGIKFNWLKIIPPENSFAYVPKVFVQRHGDGSVARANREIVAKAGSELNPLKIAPMAKVDEGQDVQIIGEQDEYFKIKPPEGSALWINKQFVDPVKMITADAAPRPAANSDAPASAPGKSVEAASASAASSPDTTASAPTTRPTGDASAAAPSTQPADPVAVAAETFDKLESDYATAGNKPITDQPVAELQASYEVLLKQDALPDSMRRIAQVRVATLKMRNEAKLEYVAFRDSQEKSNERRKALSAEQEEIETRLKQNAVTLYAAVGTLRTSSIQHSGATLYRLTDPETGRTVAYIRTSASTPASMLGQFVGVKGPISTDENLNLKIIENPTAIDPVDQSKVNGSVAAQIIPPSLVPHAAQASTGNE